MNKFLAWLEGADRWLTKKRMMPKVVVPMEDLSFLKGFLRKILVLAWILVPLAAVAYVVFFVFFYYGPKPSLTDPRLQTQAPALNPTVASRVIRDIGTDQSYGWLDSAGVLTLQVQPNVVNLALLDGGSARYAKDKTVAFVAKDPWRQLKPFGLRGLLVTGTAVQLDLNGFTYNLNILQPFVQRSDQSMIYIVDQKGQLWGAGFNSVELVSLSQAALPQTIAPNKNLNFTY